MTNSISPTGTIAMQRQFAITIRRIFRDKLREIYAYLASRQTEKEAFRMTTALDNRSFGIISNMLEELKFDLSPVVRAYIGASWLKANSDAAMRLRQGDWITFDRRVYKAVQDYAYSFLNNFISERQKELKDILTEGISTGERISTIADKIKESFRLTSWKSELIARSETIRTYGISTKTAIEKSGVTQEYQWHTSHKENVCAICKPLDKKIFNINDKTAPMPVTSTHPQCNCGITPYVRV